MSLPASWTEALDRLDRAIRGEPDEAKEWLREAVAALYGAASLHDLTREQRVISFQKISGVVLACEEDGIPDEMVDSDGVLRALLYRDGSFAPPDGVTRRQRIAGIFARYFGGVALEGPPWRCSALEPDRPTRDEMLAEASFG